MPKLIHVPKSHYIGIFFTLPLFLYFFYEGIKNHNYWLAISSLVVWVFIFLFAVNYWVQAITLFVGASVALYFKEWLVGIILFLLFIYMFFIARAVERGTLKL
jgi:hypothetical protein